MLDWPKVIIELNKKINAVKIDKICLIKYVQSHETKSNLMEYERTLPKGSYFAFYFL